MNPHLLTS
jgi:hypothetical protein